LKRRGKIKTKDAKAAATSLFKRSDPVSLCQTYASAQLLPVLLKTWLFSPQKEAIVTFASLAVKFEPRQDSGQ
jgi:hypothetical protein